MDIDKVIESRRSVRKFHDKKPNWREIIKAIDAGLHAPRSGNIGAVRFILVDDAEIIEKLKIASQQDFVGDVSYIIVACSDPRDIIRSYDERGESYVRHEAGAAIQNVLLKLTDLGLGSCWVGAFNDHQVRLALKMPNYMYIDALIPVGYSMDKTPRKRTLSLDKALYFNTYKNRMMKPRRSGEGI
jgi:nitroreductase